MLKKERDAIWAAAMLAYKSGEEPCLDYENEETAEQVAQEFQSSDPWEDVIENFIEHREYIRLSDLLTHLQVDLSRQERSHQMRCSVILKKFGWEREFRSISSKRVRVWCKTEPEPEPVSLPLELAESDPEFEVVSERSRRVDSIPVEAADQPQVLKTPLKREVDHEVDQILAQQGDQPSDRPQNLEPFSKNEVDQQPQQDREIAELVEYIRLAIEAGNRETALDIQTMLKEVCSKGAADRQKVWNSLTADEKTAFNGLISPDPTPESTMPTAERTAEPTVETVETVETATIAGAIAEPNKSEGINEEDAEKLREIASIWWDEYYPEQLQNLLTQMYGWKAPGAKYQREVIVNWLTGETAEVRDRINLLIAEKDRTEKIES